MTYFCAMAALPLFLLTSFVVAQVPVFRLQMDDKVPAMTRTLKGKDFESSGVPGWTLGMDLKISQLSTGTSLMRLMGDDKQSWLEERVSGAGDAEQLEFLLHTDYKSDPLLVAIPLKLLRRSLPNRFLLRYEGYRLDLFYDGVLVDEEWPVGVIKIGQSPTLQVSAPVSQVQVWNTALSDATVASMHGGAKAVATRADTVLGPEPMQIQYNRPRGYNTNAGDAMPFYHDGIFHLFFLLDRRQHHSKWGLGAHQWAHISSPDLVHWTHYPIALGIDHDWEGSICTGSIFFHSGRYYAYYATRMPDRSERLGVAVSEDGIHFRKSIPTPFAEPAAPFVYGPNRDPSVIQIGDEYHMLVTAAIPNGDASKTQGALEHLVSHDLSTWSLSPEPVLLSGSSAEPECSDLFLWRGWYYLIFSLRGTTHYRMSKAPLGPWTTPATEILDGPEAIVMKPAAFKGDRQLLVGFVSHDNRYAGDLVFRELVQEKDGTLGTKLPEEMKERAEGTRSIANIQLTADHPAGEAMAVGSDTCITATVTTSASSVLSINIGSSAVDQEHLRFDSAGKTVTWTDSTGKPAHAKLEQVVDLTAPMSIVLILHGTLADLSINGHRTLIHRMASSQPQQISFSSIGDRVNVSNITVSSLR